MTLRTARLVISALALVSQAASGATVPGDLQTTQVIRTAENAAELQTTLFKNIFRQEAYQDNYTERVPYEDTETYYEDVPYTERVPYTDYEEYYENEYRCRTVTDYRRECTRERECDHRPASFFMSLLVPEAKAQALDDKGVRPDPRPGPGQPLPPRPEQPRPEQPRPQPPPRPEPPRPQPPPRPEPPRPQPPPRPEPPRPQPPPRPEPPRPQPPTPRPEPRPPVCRDVERCRNVPYTRQECGYEPVRRTRPVTRYRDEIRYRREARTRTVIRYRDEVRCCVTRYREVFDHQWTLPVTLRFPADAALMAGERETFRVELGGTEAQPDVVVTPVDTIFGYTITRKDVKPGSALVEFATVPKFTAAQVGADKIRGLQLNLEGNGRGEVRFTDSVRAPRLETRYRVQIFDAAGALLAQSEQLAPLAQAVAIPLGTPLPTAQDLRIRLDVARQGVVLEGGQTAFSMNAAFSGILDIAVQRDNAKIGGIDTAGAGLDAALIFFDKAPAHPDVQTIYKISTSYKNAAGKTVYVQDKSLDRSTVQTQADGTYKLGFRELGVSDANLTARFGAGQQITISVEVFRTSGKFPGKISLWQGKTVTIH